MKNKLQIIQGGKQCDITIDTNFIICLEGLREKKTFSLNSRRPLTDIQTRTSPTRNWNANHLTEIFGQYVLYNIYQQHIYINPLTPSGNYMSHVL
jgi:hypothetical protein